jgi:hypothetical protein
LITRRRRPFRRDPFGWGDSGAFLLLWRGIREVSQGLRGCGQEWRKVHLGLDWLRPEYGGPFSEVTGVGQTGVGEGYALLREDRGNQIHNRSQRVSAYAAENLGVLQPI